MRDRGRMHLVDRIVHRRDQRSDRTAVERGQEGPPDLGQDFARDVVGLMLAVSIFGDLLARAAPPSTSCVIAAAAATSVAAWASNMPKKSPLRGSRR